MSKETVSLWFGNPENWLPKQFLGADELAEFADFVIKQYKEEQPTPESIINYIESEAEIAIPITRFSNEDGSNVTKKEYGLILIEILCAELRAKFIQPNLQIYDK